VEAKYDIGDLVILNEFGRIVLESKTSPLGLVTSKPKSLCYPLFHNVNEDPFYYWAYDILVGNQLLTDVPQEFLDRMVEIE
tara:strand:+ start:265 stop:507 length:243 start_codon:yes stop_codon:yes gene_type:complete